MSTWFLYGVLSFEKRTSRFTRNREPLTRASYWTSPGSSDCSRGPSASTNAIAGARYRDSYRLRLASNQALSLCKVRPVRNSNVPGGKPSNVIAVSSGFAHLAHPAAQVAHL